MFERKAFIISTVIILLSLSSAAALYAKLCRTLQSQITNLDMTFIAIDL